MLKCLKKRKNVVNNTALHLLADDDETAAVGSCRNMEWISRKLAQVAGM